MRRKLEVFALRVMHFIPLATLAIAAGSEQIFVYPHAASYFTQTSLKRHASVSMRSPVSSRQCHAYATRVLAVELSYLQVLGSAPTDL